MFFEKTGKFFSFYPKGNKTERGTKHKPKKLSEKSEAMLKRSLSVFALFIFIMGFCAYRIVSLSKSDYASVGQSASTRTVIIGSTRGKIYDCNLNPLVDRESRLIGAVKPTVPALTALREQLEGESFQAAESTLLKGYPTTVRLKYEPDCRDILCFQVPQRYGEKSSAEHFVGYVDGEGKGVYGVERSFDKLLSENGGEVSVTYSIDAVGRVLTGTEPKVKGKKADVMGGVVLTLDSRIQAIAEAALDSSNIERGAAVVLEVESGAIRAGVSRPGFDRNRLSDSLKDEGSPLLNKTLCAYSIGSVFKPFIAAEALESGITLPVCECTGKLRVNDTVFTCPGERGHGAVDLAGALQKSCNIYFIKLALSLDRDSLLGLCRDMGFGKSTALAEGITGAAGVLPEAGTLRLKGELANLAFGQGKLSATPLQMAAAYRALASGVYSAPYLVEGTVDSQGQPEQESPPKQSRVLSDKTAAALRDLLKRVVLSGGGEAACPFFTTAGGKTGTAQSGIFNDGKEIYRTWFAGFFPADEPKYVAVVLSENGKSGAADCAPVFRAIADGIAQAEGEKPNRAFGG